MPDRVCQIIAAYVQEQKKIPIEVKEAFDGLRDNMHEEETWVEENWDQVINEIEGEWEPSDIPIANLGDCAYRNFRILESFVNGDEDYPVAAIVVVSCVVFVFNFFFLE